MDVQDEGYCAPPRVCPAPSFAFWRKEGTKSTDILLPFMVGTNHRRVRLLSVLACADVPRS